MLEGYWISCNEWMQSNTNGVIKYAKVIQKQELMTVAEHVVMEMDNISSIIFKDSID